MSDFRKLGIPFLVIFLSALIIKLLTIYISDMSTTVLQILTVISMCLFGATLNISFRKRSKSVWKKVVAVLMILFLLFMELNLFTFTQITDIFNMFGLSSLYIHLLYVFCGYLLVD